MFSISSKSLAVISLSAFALVQAASSRDFAEIYTDCGLGALIAPSNDAVAAVTNVTWDLGTTAISSNISSPDSCTGGQQRTAAFIYQSYDSIASDLSKGEGKYLTALLVVAGYAEEDIAQASEFLRADFAELVAQEGYSSLSHYEKTEQLYGILYGENV